MMRRLLTLGLAWALAVFGPLLAHAQAIQLGGVYATAPIGIPTSLGTTSNTGTSLSLTTSVDAPAGSLIIVWAAVNNTTESSTGTSDSAGNIYVALNQTNSGVSQWQQAFFTISTHDLPSGGTITFTQSCFCAEQIGAAFDGGIGGLNINGTGVNYSSTTSPAVSTGTLSNANEIIFGLVDNNNNPTYTQSSGFTAINSMSVNTDVHFVYKIVSSTVSVTYNPTLSATESTTINVFTFRGQ